MLEVIDYENRTARLEAIMNRSAGFEAAVDESVREIIASVRTRGDEAVLAYTQRFDGVRPDNIEVDYAHAEQALRELDPELREVIEEAAENIRRFHSHQRRDDWYVDEAHGVRLGQRVLPLERVGLYVPGGTASYPSSVLMNVVPAQVAGVEEILLASPPQADGLPRPLILATAAILGIRRIYAMGGAQAVAAFAYGTDSVPAVDKIVGPGNAFVASAKRQVYGTVDIDSFAGPSEIVVMADHSADAEFIAADLLSQAEHDARASAILVTPSRDLAERVARLAEDMTAELPRKDIISQSLRDFGACIVAPDLDACVEIVNALAPEHLELLVADPWDQLQRIKHAGAVFLGPYATEPVGDYFAGPNHVLPTSGTARFASALSVDDFVRRQSVVSYTRERLLHDGPKIVRFARAEGLDAHARAVQVRLDRS